MRPPAWLCIVALTACGVGDWRYEEQFNAMDDSNESRVILSSRPRPGDSAGIIIGCVEEGKHWVAFIVPNELDEYRADFSYRFNSEPAYGPYNLTVGSDTSGTYVLMPDKNADFFVRRIGESQHLAVELVSGYWRSSGAWDLNGSRNAIKKLKNCKRKGG